MKHFYPALPRWVSGSVWVTLLFFLALSSQVNAQQSSLGTPNSTTSTPWVSPTFSLTTAHASPGLSCWGGDLGCLLADGSPANVTNPTLTDYDELAIAISGAGSFTVGENNPANIYDAGNFAGFLISNSSLADVTLLGAVTITTYKNGEFREEKTATNLIGINSALVSGAYEVGFHTTLDFNQIAISFTNPLTVATSYRVYYALMRRYASASTTLACNTPSSLTAPGNSIYISDRTGIVTDLACALCAISNADNIIDGNTSNVASISLTAAVATTATIGVKNPFTAYTASTSAPKFVGFDISSTDLVDLGLLDRITISTYKTGTATPIQSVSGTSLISANSSLLSGTSTGRRTLGFLATADFDEIVLTVTKAVGVSVARINVYGVTVTSFCDGPSLDCADNTIPKNTITPLVYPTNPVYVDGKNTGITGTACALCYISNSENVIDNDPSNFASLSLTAGVSTTLSFAVANALQTYPVNSFAGFDIETRSLLSANVLSIATITLYNDGSPVQTIAGNALIVGATTSLLNGRSRQYVGVVATAQYDEVKISFPSVVGVDLGVINIYSAVFEKTCSAAISCNTTYNLSNPTFPVVIDYERTGVTGAVDAAVTVADAWNVVSSSTTDYATITNTAGVAVTASIGVLNPIDTYPAGTFAGFTIRKISGLVTANLLAKLTITTYQNGSPVQSRTASDLLDLSIALFGSVTDYYNIGFVTSQPFDEIRLSVAPLVGLGVTVTNLQVYGAFINTNLSIGNGFTCALKTSPDFAVTYKNVSVSGSVATNDNVPAGTTYGTSPTLVSSPNGSTPTLTMNSDGTYTFITSTSGVYVYSVPVCVSAVCVSQTLTVTVLDPKVNTNLPVANPDVASMTSTTATTPPSVTVNVKANDGPGNPGGTLGTPTIATPPTNGSATVDGNGNIVYTPNTGFYGTDVLTYQVCETPGNLCATATVTISVYPPDYVSASASDDYVFSSGTAVTGNVLTNDIGTGLTVSNPGTTVGSSGTLVISSTGSYTFTPALGYTGPGSFTYTACDSNSPSNCVMATLHALVNIPDLSPTIILPLANFNTAPNNVRNFIVNIFEANGQPTPPGSVSITITVPTGYTISYNSSITSTSVSGGSTVSVENPNWTVVNNLSDQQLTLKNNAGQIIPANATAVLGFTITRTTANSGSTANITVNVTNDPTKTYDANPLNNVYARIISGQ
ncbi:beta strand repeat-containing protein [Spirosoma aerolatum]|uniref:beta strand repeat-containing protein n=1 Tax=Spirosoma aerolatum TaxID=1211326 RepID=UPI0009AEA649|nr:Ig-like domain-containing protein [Spirosoma aerolatum]